MLQVSWRRTHWLASSPGLRPDFVSQPRRKIGCEIKSGQRPGDEAIVYTLVRYLAEHHRSCTATENSAAVLTDSKSSVAWKEHNTSFVVACV